MPFYTQFLKKISKICNKTKISKSRVRKSMHYLWNVLKENALFFINKIYSLSINKLINLPLKFCHFGYKNQSVFENSEKFSGFLVKNSTEELFFTNFYLRIFIFFAFGNYKYICIYFYSKFSISGVGWEKRSYVLTPAVAYAWASCVTMLMLRN